MARSKIFLPIGKEPLYDKMYDRLRLNSPILNAGNIRSIDINLSDERSLKQAQITLKDNIPELEREVKEIDERFKIYQQKRVNAGFDRPEKMNLEQRKNQVETIARIDVSKEELNEVERLLKKYSEARAKVQKSKILKNGLIQHSCLDSYGIIKEIDGQKCSVIRGVVCIDEDLSPYDGLPVVEYRKIANKWARELAERINENERIRNNAIKHRLDEDEIKFKPKFPPFPPFPEDVLSMKVKI